MIPYRAQSADIGRDDLYDVPISRYTSIAEINFDLEQPRRYIITPSEPSLPLDFLLIPRRHSRLLVGFHGAENRTASDLPKFQFTRSLGAREESALFLSDSTLLLHEKIHIGWHIGNKQTPLANQYSEVVKAAGKALAVDETVLVGHSAGGFSAILVGAHVPNSRAISINGQSVVTEYEPWTVTRIMDSVLIDAKSHTELLGLYGDRLDLRVALHSRLASSSFTYFAHVDDQATMGRLPHFALLAKHFGVNPTDGGRTLHGDAFVPCRWTTSNPSAHALPGTVIPFVDLVVRGQATMDLGNLVDPTWQR